MAQESEFSLLGPLEVRCGGTAVAIAPGKQRSVLAVLLLSAGQVVPVDELVATLWGTAPPPSARVTVQNYVRRLRQALGEAGRERIVTRPPGYLMTLAAGELDVTRFEGLVRGARAAAREGSWARVADHADAALALWRGDPLSDVESEELAMRVVPRLAELRLQALELRIDARLRLGRNDTVIPELRALTASHPLREHFHAQRMLALYRAGRQAEALAAYQQARQVLVDELGAEPGAELRDLHRRVLAADPALAGPTAAEPEAAPAPVPATTQAPPVPVQEPVPGPGPRPVPRPVPAELRELGRESPYQGLIAFRERDAAFFFGREAAALQLLGAMARRIDGPGLLVVSGASGVGKSSLLHAGILPRLRSFGLPGAAAAASWPRLVLTPGRAPLDELAVGVARLTGADAAQVRRGLGDDPAGFALTARQARTAGAGDDGDADGEPRRLLLVIDQFEQLFVQCPDEAQRRALITALHAATSAGPDVADTPAVLAVLVVRADFETRCAHYPELAAAVQDRYLVTPMTGRQLRLAITAPAAAAGAAVAEDLVGVLLHDLDSRQAQGSGTEGRAGPAAGPGLLPLLSHALDQAWRNRAGETLTLADYERAGGVEGAVTDSAERAYQRLTPADRAAAPRVFTRLVATDADGTDTAGEVPRAELAEGENPEGARAVAAVVESFAAERLLTLSAESVRISHEVLLSAWPLLRDTWLAGTRADRINRTRLHATAAEWSRQSRDPSYLYRGSLLDAARGTAAAIAAAPGRLPPLSRVEHDFLHASDRVRRRAARRRQALVALLAALAVALASAAALALHASRAAAAQRNATVAGQLIAGSAGLGEANPVLARLESLAAYDIDPTPQTRAALLTAAALPGLAVFGANSGEVYSVAFSPGAALLAVGSGNSAGAGPGVVTLWDVATRREAGVIHTGDTGGVTALAFSADGTTLAAGTLGGAVSLWDVATRHQNRALPTAAPGGIIRSLAFQAGGATLAAAGGNGAVWLWDTATGRLARSFRTGSINSAAFSPDGRTLAVGATGSVTLWDVTAGRETGGPLTTAAATNFSVAFSPDGRTLAVGTLAINGVGTVSLWDVPGRHRTAVLLDSAGDGVTSLAFGPTGETLAAGGYEGAVLLFDVATRVQLSSPLTGDSGLISSIAFSPDGTTLVTGSYDATARLWAVGATVTMHQAVSGSRAGPGAKTASAALSPDGKTVAVGFSNGVVLLFNVATWTQAGPPIVTGKAAVSSLAFSADDTTLATVDGDSMVQLWDVATHRQTGALRARTASLGTVVSVAVGPGGKTLAAVGYTGGYAGVAQLFNVAAGRPVGAPLGDGDPDIGAAFSPDGATLATASIDGVIRLWDVATGQRSEQDLSVAPAAAVSLAFAPGGHTLAVGESNGTVRLFDLPTGQPIGAPLNVAAPSPW